MEENQQADDQVEWEGGDQSSLQPDALAIQQLLNSDSMPNGIGPGEVMYVMVGTTTYQITGPQEAGGEVTISPVTNLEELASIGAIPEEGGAEAQQQENEDGEGEDADQTEQADEQEAVQQDEHSEQEDDTEQHSPEEHDDQQSLQQEQESQQPQQQTDENEQEEMTQHTAEQQQQQLLQEQQQQEEDTSQIQQEPQHTTQQPNEAALQQLTSSSSNQVGGGKLEGTTLSLAGGDFVLQPGQQLPPEIQEMIAKGLPIDMSNFEFVVDDEQQPPQPQQLATTSNNTQTQNGLQYRNSNTENINPNASEQADEQPKNGIFVQVVTACPGEFDDGEFPQFPTISQDQRLNNSAPYKVTKSFCLTQFIDYVSSGGKVSTVMKMNPQQQQQQHYTPMQESRSILLNNQMQNKFKRKRMMDNEEDDDDVGWKSNDAKRQRAKHQRMSVQPPNISKHSSKLLSQQELMMLHQATSVVSSHLIFEMPVAYIMQNEPHNYQKGDFVVDKKDAYLSSFPMWRIESSKLLQKFEPFVENGVYMHKSASVYSSWSGDIRTNFRAVLADILSTSSAPIGRKQEIVVRVHNKYIPKPADEKLEQNALMQFFNIYVHVLLNQVFEPAYLTAIRQQNVDYYLEPMTQIDQLIAEAKQGVLLECNWNSLFQVALETWSTYTFGPLRPTDVKQQCQAVAAGGPAVKVVKFYGQNYNADNLQADQDVGIGSNRVVEFLVGRTAMANLGVYHALHHFKYLLFRRCHDEAVFQVSTQKKSSSDVPDICIQNRIWVQQMFQDLKGLLDRYIIIKTEEENAENSPEH